MILTQGMQRLLEDYGRAEREYGFHCTKVCAAERDTARSKLQAAIRALEERNRYLEGAGK